MLKIRLGKMRTAVVNGWDVMAQMVAFVRVAYQKGIPKTEGIPLLGLLPRRLTYDEVTELVIDLARLGESMADTVDIGVAITRITNELPTVRDLERVQRRLAEANGAPVDHDD